ncbi:hypothetical protein H257_19000 [Aphanomyces astaci]|uniref:CBM1 domain-containing protein n=1 Tax=Aphanomyces astaci TaxID=112090 RepID=W4FB91_APHAT|nr:hypothetical protein H257_19000 [Aphanomyces astaci]ETV64056.1 hypothetical protein H257_19000 [Aphanomyces astaci]|eukprot:XP_009846459.1 hypothetical protein H257_19000 [Aphanomyces astaci]
MVYQSMIMILVGAIASTMSAAFQDDFPASDVQFVERTGVPTLTIRPDTTTAFPRTTTAYPTTTFSTSTTTASPFTTQTPTTTTKAPSTTAPPYYICGAGNDNHLTQYYNFYSDDNILVRSDHYLSPGSDYHQHESHNNPGSFGYHYQSPHDYNFEPGYHHHFPLHDNSSSGFHNCDPGYHHLPHDYICRSGTTTAAPATTTISPTTTTVAPTNTPTTVDPTTSTASPETTTSISSTTTFTPTSTMATTTPYPSTTAISYHEPLYVPGNYTGNGTSNSSTSSSSPEDIVFCDRVSVERDATYCISGPICSGSGDVPRGVQCPQAGAVAVAQCLPTLSSYNEPLLAQCIAPAAAVCQKLVVTDAWGCVLPGGCGK